MRFDIVKGLSLAGLKDELNARADILAVVAVVGFEAICQVEEAAKPGDVKSSTSSRELKPDGRSKKITSEELHNGTKSESVAFFAKDGSQITEQEYELELAGGEVVQPEA